MSNRIGIRKSGSSAPAQINGVALPHGERMAGIEPPPSHDRVSLSLAYRAIRESAIAVRIRTLGVRYAVGAYRVPATDIGHSMMSEHLIRF